MADLGLPEPRTCRGRRCDAPVIFVAAAHSDRTMCLDAAPHPTKGNVWLRDAHDGQGLRAQVLTVDVARAHRAGGPMWLAHHASCPDVDEFRGGR